VALYGVTVLTPLILVCPSNADLYVVLGLLVSTAGNLLLGGNCSLSDFCSSHDAEINIIEKEINTAILKYFILKFL